VSPYPLGVIVSRAPPPLLMVSRVGGIRSVSEGTHFGSVHMQCWLAETHFSSVDTYFVSVDTYLVSVDTVDTYCLSVDTYCLSVDTHFEGLGSVHNLAVRDMKVPYHSPDVYGDN